MYTLEEVVLNNMLVEAGYGQILELACKRSRGCIKGSAGYVVKWLCYVKYLTVAPSGHTSAIRGMCGIADDIVFLSHC